MGFFGEALDTIGAGKTHKLGTNPAKLDPRYTNLVGNVTKSAKDFRTNIPNIVGQKTSALMDNSRMNLAKSYVDADRASNARGLFYGVKRAAQGLEDTGIEAAYGMQADQQALYDQAYNEALSRRQSEIDKRSGILNKMGQVAPQLVGGLLGGKGGGSKGGSGGGQTDAGTNYSLASRTA